MNDREHTEAVVDDPKGKRQADAAFKRSSGNDNGDGDGDGDGEKKTNLQPKETAVSIEEKTDGLTESDLVNTFVREQTDRLVFDPDPTLKCWLSWDKHTWRQEQDNGVVHRAAGALMKRAALDSTEPDDPEKRKSFVIKVRRCEDAIVALAHSRLRLNPGEKWDQQSLLLGCDNGVINLETSERQPGKPLDRIKRRARVEYDPNASNINLRWDRLLKDVFIDPELIAWVKLAIGYSLTGLRNERCFFFCEGSGHNGKSTVLNTIKEVLGDYGTNIPLTALIVGKGIEGGSKPAPDLLRFNGPRFAVCLENEKESKGIKGLRIREGLLKALTGGTDQLSIRGLYDRRSTDFYPSAKLWIGVNERPRVADLTSSFRGRVRYIKFPRSFEGDEIDPNLDADLKKEHIEILLQFAIYAKDYLTKLRETGKLVLTCQPPGGAAQVEDWFMENDPLQKFISECCEMGPGCGIKRTTLQNVLSTWWVEDQGPDHIPSPTALGRYLGEMGITKIQRRINGIREKAYSGIQLKSDYDSS